MADYLIIRLSIDMKMMDMMGVLALVFTLKSEVIVARPLDYDSFLHISITESEGLDNDIQYLYYYSEKCMHCQRIKAKSLRCLSRLNGVAFINVEGQSFRCKTVNPQFNNDYCIVGTPTLFIIEKSKVIERFVGVKAIETFFSTIPCY